MTTNSTVEALLLAIRSIHSKVGTEEDEEDLQSLERIINSPEMRKAVEVRGRGKGGKERERGRKRGGGRGRGGEGGRELTLLSVSVVVVRLVRFTRGFPGWLSYLTLCMHTEVEGPL